MLHLRMTVPPDLSPAVVGLLEDDPRVSGLVVLPGAARRPAGDAVLCDVAREGASDVLERLRVIGVNDHGTLALEHVDGAPTRRARLAERAAPGAPDDGVVWPMVREQAEDGVRPSWSFYAFLTLATLLAAIAVVLDSSVLVIGAMVLGPEFAPVVAVALALVLRDRRAARRRPAPAAARLRSWRSRSPCCWRCWRARAGGSRSTTCWPTGRRPPSSGRRTAGRSSSPCWPAPRACCR